MISLAVAMLRAMVLGLLAWFGVVIPAHEDTKRPMWMTRKRPEMKEEDERAEVHFASDLRQRNTDEEEFWRDFWGTADGRPPEG